MLARPATPGVYVQPVDADRGAVRSLRTDIAGFVGIAERGPVGVAVAIETMGQFESVFGSYIAGGYLAYAVRAFFENGGRRCRVVRATSREAARASGRIRLGDGAFGLTLSASSPGAWGDGLSVGVAPARGADTLARPGGDPRATPVADTHGLEPRAYVRLQQGPVILFRIVAAVDPVSRTIFWVNPEPGLRQPWEAPLSGLDFNLPLRIERVDFTLTVRERGRLVAGYPRLSVVLGAERYAPDVLQVRAPFDGRRPSDTALERLSPPMPLIEATIADGTAAAWATVPLAGESGAIVSLAGGRDGLTTLSAQDFVGQTPSPAAKAPERIATLRGLAALELADDVAILAVPDIHIQPAPILYDPRPRPPGDPCEPCPPAVEPTAAPPAPIGELPPIFDESAIHYVQAAMIDQCERLRDRFAVLDPPFKAARDTRPGVGPVIAWRSRFDTAFGALYHPWILVADPRVRGGVRPVPPSGHVSGQFAATDLAVGPHRAPAGAPLTWAQAATAEIGGTLHGVLNDAGVNVVTVRNGRLLRILGARTMSSDLTWRFVPVRRLVSMLREALDVSTQWAVFEPNDETTRLSLSQGIGDFLMELWRRGALAGETSAAAFRVRCDENNNDAERRANGELHVDIAIAPSSPFEFIILRVGRQGNSFELVEDGAAGGSLLGGGH